VGKKTLKEFKSDFKNLGSCKTGDLKTKN